MNDPSQKQFELMKAEVDKMSPAARDLVLHILQFQTERGMTALDLSGPLREVMEAFERWRKRIKDGGEA